MASSATPDRILDATLELLASAGVAALSLEDVAQTAGVSRQTVYRHFGNRDQLFAATVLREEQVFIDRLLLVTRAQVDLRSALEASIRETLLAARQHPLLDRLLETEPEALLPFLTSGSSPVLPAARPVLAEMLARFLPERSAEALELVADLCTRLIISYTANPPHHPVDDVATALADLVVNGIGA